MTRPRPPIFIVLAVYQAPPDDDSRSPTGATIPMIAPLFPTLADAQAAYPNVTVLEVWLGTGIILRHAGQDAAQA